MKDITGKFKAVIFDMDGTIIEPLLDFRKIRSDIGISANDDILESIRNMPTAQAQIAREKLLSHEMTAAENARLMPNAIQSIELLKAAGIKLALLTRNTKPAMEYVLKKFSLCFDITWAREDGPIKPQPDSILKVCGLFNVTPQQAACVGDYYYDMVASNSAGTTSILLACNEIPEYASAADIVIKDLGELPKILIA